MLRRVIALEYCVQGGFALECCVGVWWLLRWSVALECCVGVWWLLRWSIALQYCVQCYTNYVNKYLKGGKHSVNRNRVMCPYLGWLDF